MSSVYRLLALVPAVLGILVVVGCYVKPTTSSPSAQITTGEKEGTKVAKKVDDHSGWWCDEHGLPEDVCDLCSRKYREAEKKKGNWCEHDRVKTSCFKCTPEAREKYSKEYEARFGKKPPEPDPEEPAVKEKEKAKS